jgi:RNA polymerase sigma factor (sigma-70 family)
VSARLQPTPESPFGSCARSFEAELDYVYRTLRRHGVTDRDAEDLAQDVFVVMWRRWSDYDPGRSLRSWLAGIAVKIAQRYHRAHSRREIPYDDVDRADEAPGPDDQVASSRLRALVLATLASLPDKYRGIFVMHELDGISVREISNELALPLFTVHTRLRRARLRFTAALRELDLVPAEALRLEREPIAVPAATRERLRARLAALALRPAPAPFPPPLPWASPWPWVTVAAAAAGAVTVAVWRAPSPELRAPAAPPPAGLVGRWSFEETSGGTIRDLSGAGHDCVGHELAPAASIAGVHGRALDLGARGWLECPQPAAAAGRPLEMTVSVWFNRARARPNSALVTRHLGPDRENLFYLGFAEDNLRAWSGAWTGWVTVQQEETGQWRHVAFTHQGRTTRLYLDGRLVREQNSGVPRGAGTTESPLTIGAAVHGTDVSHYFDGAVDEVRLYDRALTGPEVAALAEHPGS